MFLDFKMGSTASQLLTVEIWRSQTWRVFSRNSLTIYRKSLYIRNSKNSIFFTPTGFLSQWMIRFSPNWVCTFTQLISRATQRGFLIFSFLADFWEIKVDFLVIFAQNGPKLALKSPENRKKSKFQKSPLCCPRYQLGKGTDPIWWESDHSRAQKTRWREFFLTFLLFLIYRDFLYIASKFRENTLYVWDRQISTVRSWEAVEPILKSRNIGL